jgi:hypothetical protein
MTGGIYGERFFMTKAGDMCPICKNGTIKHKFHTIGETRFENYRCDICAARFCLKCGGTLNVRGASCQYKNQCNCEEGDLLVDKSFVFEDDELEREEA